MKYIARHTSAAGAVTHWMFAGTHWVAITRGSFEKMIIDGSGVESLYQPVRALRGKRPTVIGRERKPALTSFEEWQAAQPAR